MPGVLHDIEITLLRALRDAKAADHSTLAERTGLGADQVRRGVEWLRHKGLANVARTETRHVRLGRNGIRALESGMPERRLLDIISGGARGISHLRDALGEDFGPAIGAARRNGWARIEGGSVVPGAVPDEIPGEGILRRIGRGTVEADSLDGGSLEYLAGRPEYILIETRRSSTVSASASSGALDLDAKRQNAIDVEAPAPPAYPAKRNPLREVINEIRETFALLGFTEVTGSMVQSSFWNFDALFTPQDHPAREMQDTFFLESAGRTRDAPPDTVRSVAREHRDAWGRAWSREESERTVLRTHTTCVTIRHLAESRPGESRIFSLGRVFRNEKVSYRHLVEFHQIEGVVTGRNVTLRDLMGIQKEFYGRMGLDRVKFWPTFFPYTEPSLQSMVYSEELGKWIELFGMGIFRPQVTGPLGIEGPVLAWGGGIERMAMLRYGLDDVREFYGNNMRWLRGEAGPPPEGR